MKLFFTLSCLLLLGNHFLYAQCENNNDPNIHLVKEKETLYGIAKEYGVSVKQLCELNDITVKSTLYICQELKLPVPSQFITKDATVTSLHHRLPYHTVQKGETIAELADKYGYTEEKFRAFNQLPAQTEVEVGTRLKTSNCEMEIKEPVIPPVKVPAVEIMKAPKTIHVPKVERREKSKDKGVAMLEEINLFRSNPKAYIPYVLEHQETFVKRGRSSHQLNETIEELIDILKVQEPLPLLQFSSCAYDVAQAKAVTMQKNVAISHFNLAGATPWERLKAKCLGCKDGTENFVWGATSIRDLIIVLLIDNGTENKRHRNSLLNPKWTHAACYHIGDFSTQKQFMKNFWIQEFIEQ